ncbi:MAG: hypothetical protein JNK67_31200 [Alphaproteobacteria bacterium]|nr:hypothetical protein [Alphaproteobacteria bacterium]
MLGVWLATIGIARADDAQALQLAIRQLVAAQHESGLFRFGFDFANGTAHETGTTKNEKTTTIVRQAVGAYGLAKYYLHTGDAGVRPTIERAIEALAARSIPVSPGGVPAWMQRAGLFDIPWGRRTLTWLLSGLGLLHGTEGAGRLVAADGGLDTAWVGGTAMALLAELHYARASGDERFASWRRAWLDGIMALYVEGAGFREFAGSIDETPLSNAEAWLALSFLPPAEAASLGDRLARLDRYMVGTYTAAPTLHMVHWGTMAAAQRGDAIDARAARDLVESVADHVLRTIPAERVLDENTCVLVEGFAAMDQVFRRAPPHDGELAARIEARIALEMTKNLALQIVPGQAEVERSDGRRLPIPDDARAAGAFIAMRSRPVIRVDYTAHCISALIELQRRAARR